MTLRVVVRSQLGKRAAMLCGWFIGHRVFTSRLSRSTWRVVKWRSPLMEFIRECLLQAWVVKTSHVVPAMGCIHELGLLGVCMPLIIGVVAWL